MEGEAGALQIPIYQTCNHLSSPQNPREVESYCRKCELFICEECSLNHVDHIDSIEDWRSISREYINKCVSYQKRTQILLRSTQNVDQIRAQVMDKVDKAMQRLLAKIKTFKKQLKETIWATLIGQAYRMDASKIGNSPNLEKIGDNLKAIEEDFLSLERKGDKNAMIKYMQNNLLNDLEQKIGYFKEEKSHEMKVSESIKQFKIEDAYSYSKFKDSFNIEFPKMPISGQATLYSLEFEELDNSQNYGLLYHLSNRGRVAKKTQKDSIITILSGNPTIQEGRYEVEMRVDKYINDMFHIGMGPDSERKHNALNGKHGFAMSEAGLLQGGSLVTNSKLKTGDLVRIEVDAKPNTGSIQFYKNGDKEGTSMDFDPRMEYYFGIAMRRLNSQITILTSKHYK